MGESESGNDIQQLRKKSTKNKRSRSSTSMFDVVEQFDTQDLLATKQHKRMKLDIQRSKAAQSQTKIYSSLLECRILLQRSITQQQKVFHDDDDDDEKQQQQTIPILDDIEKNVNDLLVNFLHARRMLQKGISRNDDDDDDDSRKRTDQMDYYKNLVSNSTVDDDDDDPLDNVLEMEYQKYRNQWKEVFDRRQRDVQLHTGQLTAKSSQFRVIDSSLWQQVEATVQHERVQQQQRQRYSTATNGDDEEDIITTSSKAYWNFDDSKVYEQLLKDFVTTASSQTGREEVVAAQERILKKQQKNKKSGTNNNNSNDATNTTGAAVAVDRKASKGRKIRYTNIPKLQNFTFPLNRQKIDTSTTSDHSFGGATSLTETEWFASLFGGRSMWKK